MSRQFYGFRRTRSWSFEALFWKVLFWCWSCFGPGPRYGNGEQPIKIIGNFHGTLSYERQRKVIKKFGWSFRLAGFDALNYCLLAEGRVDAVIEANLKPYDILPLIPIIKNSGAIVTNWDNQAAETGGNILATSNRSLHNKILKLLKPFVK